VVVPKQGKARYQDPKSYRPISLLSCFGKALESLMAQRVTKAAEECGAIVDTQMGGRKNYSGVDVLINISTPMSQSLRRRDKYQNLNQNIEEPY
jgi:CO dehydrogenase nickel-insertion accessory protein CooC1